jgi:hypothetical protein
MPITKLDRVDVAKWSGKFADCAICGKAAGELSFARGECPITRRELYFQVHRECFEAALVDQEARAA